MLHCSQRRLNFLHNLIAMSTGWQWLPLVVGQVIAVYSFSEYTGKNILAFFTLAEVEYPCVFLQEWFEGLFCIARLSFAGLCIPGFWTLLLYYSVGLEAVAISVMLFARMTKRKFIDMRLSAHHTWWPYLFARWNVISWLCEVLVLCSSLCVFSWVYRSHWCLTVNQCCCCFCCCYCCFCLKAW